MYTSIVILCVCVFECEQRKKNESLWVPFCVWSPASASLSYSNFSVANRLMFRYHSVSFACFFSMCMRAFVYVYALSVCVHVHLQNFAHLNLIEHEWYVCDAKGFHRSSNASLILRFGKYRVMMMAAATVAVLLVVVVVVADSDGARTHVGGKLKMINKCTLY